MTQAQTPTAQAAPRAARHPVAVPSPHGTRIDDYYWLRDDTRSDPQVLEYLEQENAYAEAVLAPLRPLEQRLFTELTARLQPDEASVPVRHQLRATDSARTSTSAASPGFERCVTTRFRA